MLPSSIAPQRKSPGAPRPQGFFKPGIGVVSTHRETALSTRRLGYETWHGSEISRTIAAGQGHLMSPAKDSYSDFASARLYLSFPRACLAREESRIRAGQRTGILHAAATRANDKLCRAQ